MVWYRRRFSLCCRSYPWHSSQDDVDTSTRTRACLRVPQTVGVEAWQRCTRSCHEQWRDVCMIASPRLPACLGQLRRHLFPHRSLPRTSAPAHGSAVLMQPTSNLQYCQPVWERVPHHQNDCDQQPTPVVVGRVSAGACAPYSQRQTTPRHGDISLPVASASPCAGIHPLARPGASRSPRRRMRMYE